MSETKKIKTIKDLDDSFKSLVVPNPADGDTRRINKRFEKGHTFVFDGYDRSFTLKEDVTMDVTELYSGHVWSNKHYHVGTSKPCRVTCGSVKLGRWRRMWAWLFGSKIPVARVIEP